MKTMNLNTRVQLEGSKELGTYFLSEALTILLAKGMSTNYVVLDNFNHGHSLIIRLCHPGRHSPQSIGRFNHVSVSALVQTNHDQEFSSDTFIKLVDVISSDLEENGNMLPQYLASHGEVRGSGLEGWIANMDELRRCSNMKKPDHWKLESFLH